MLNWFRRNKDKDKDKETQPTAQPQAPEDASIEIVPGEEPEVPVSYAPPEELTPKQAPADQNPDANEQTRSAVEIAPANLDLSPQYEQPVEAQEAPSEGDVRNVPEDTLLSAMEGGELPTEVSDIPEVKKGFFSRLKDRLSKTKTTLVEKVRSAIRLHGKVDEELLEEIEMILIQSDVGVATTQKIVGRMRDEARKQGALDPDSLLTLFKSSIEEILHQNSRRLNVSAGRPTIILMVGVNGTGKTTTIGKIAKQLTDQGKSVLMVAADTFRAAAIEQLTVWADRSGAQIVRMEQGSDPAAVIFTALEEAKRTEPDVVLIDTAGRLHTKANLMEELKKIVRVIRKHYTDAPHETVLVLDATTGQNAVNQVQIFHDACNLTGLIMTKLDGTAKGGILIACKDMYDLPILKIGIGEGAEDLRDFDPHEFVDALFSNGNGNGEGSAAQS